MAQRRMCGLRVAVDNVDAAAKVLSDLGMLPSVGDGGIWVAGRHFVSLTNRQDADGRSICLSGDGDDFDIEDIRFRYYRMEGPEATDLEDGDIVGIDHVITMLSSIVRAEATLCEQGFTRSEPIREFPAISTLARMIELGEGYVELNEPLGSGVPAWENASGIVGLVLQCNNIDEFRSKHPSARLSRSSEVQARKPGQELETLGLVSLVKTRAFNDFQLFLFEPWLR